MRSTTTFMIAHVHTTHPFIAHLHNVAVPRLFCVRFFNPFFCFAEKCHSDIVAGNQARNQRGNLGQLPPQISKHRIAIVTFAGTLNE